MPSILKFSFIIVIISVVTNSVFSQITLTLPSQESCPGSFDIPVQTTDFNDVASVSLKIKFDSAVVVYDGYTDLNPAFNTGMFLINATGKEIIFSWFSLNPVTLGSTNLLILHFHHLKNVNTSIAWNNDSLGNCVITDLNGVEFSLELINSVIGTTFHEPLPVSPVNQAVNVTENPVLHWNGSSCGPHYNLKYSTDPDFLTDTNNYTGIFGTNQSITGLNFSTTYYWKVQAIINSSPFYTNWSETFSFTTRDPDGLEDIESTYFNYQLFPNPVGNAGKLTLNILKNLNVKIQIFDLSGKRALEIIDTELHPGTYKLEFNTNNLESGLYFLKIQAVSSVIMLTKSKKFTIIQ